MMLNVRSNSIFLAPINVLSMPDFKNYHKDAIVGQFADHAIISHTYAVDAIEAAQFPAAGGARIGGKKRNRS
jgi:hypothetical protein